MGLVDTNSKERVDIPHEPDQWVELRPLTGIQMQEAADIRTQKTLSRLSDLFTKVDPKTFQKAQSGAEEETQQYDEETLISYAVVGWSYEEPCTGPNKELLDSTTRAWLAKEIESRNTHGPLPGGLCCKSDPEPSHQPSGPSTSSTEQESNRVLATP